MEHERRIRAKDLPKGEFQVLFNSSSGASLGAFNLFDQEYLSLLGISSLEPSTLVSSDSFFPSKRYFETGRGKGLLPSYHAALGSAGAGLESLGVSRALSCVAFLDTSGHNGSLPHINFEVWGWPKRMADPDFSKRLGEVHILPADGDITMITAPNTPIERRTTIFVRQALKDQNAEK